MDFNEITNFLRFLDFKNKIDYLVNFNEVIYLEVCDLDKFFYF